jgi:hypothetical protein
VQAIRAQTVFKKHRAQLERVGFHWHACHTRKKTAFERFVRALDVYADEAQLGHASDVPYVFCYAIVLPFFLFLFVMSLPPSFSLSIYYCLPACTL